MKSDRFRVYLALACCVAIGYLVAQYTYEPHVVTVMAQSESPEIKWEYTETPIPVPYRIEVVKEVHHTETVYSDVPDLKFFEDKDELQEWVQTNLVEDMGSQRCVAEALEMQRRAIADGYQVAVQALFTGLTESVDQEWEMVVSAFTETGSMYYVWPVSGKIRYTGHSIKGIK